MSSPADKRRRAEAAEKYTHAGRALASILLQVLKSGEKEKIVLFLVCMYVVSSSLCIDVYMSMDGETARKKKRAPLKT